MAAIDGSTLLNAATGPIGGGVPRPDARRWLRRGSRGLVAVAVLAALVGLGAPPAAADWVRNDQWQTRTLDFRDAWKLSAGDGVTVAVIDSGVDGTHPDLAGQVLSGIDLVEGGNGWTDPVGHGTAVAGLLAGRNDDGSGVVGLAPKAKILPVRVLDKANKYDDPAIVAKGVHWAVDHGATVLNLSLGGQLRSDVLAEALHYAARHDVVVVACTGNVTAGQTSRAVWYPAREPGVVAVAGLVIPSSSSGTSSTTASASAGGNGGGSSTESLWSDSLTGPETVLSAPAVNLLGAKPGGYWRVQGTSFASPLVAATAALLRSRYPGMSAANVVNRLIRTARDLGTPGRDDQYGYGEVNPVAALRSNLPPVTSNPLGGQAGPAGGPPNSGGRPVGAGDQHTTGVPAPGASPENGPVTPTAAAGGGTDGFGLSARAASAERRIGASFALGGAVAALLFVAGVLITRRARRRPF